MLSTWETETGDCYKLEANLGYILVPVQPGLPCLKNSGRLWKSQEKGPLTRENKSAIGFVFFRVEGEAAGMPQDTPVRCYNRLWPHTKQAEVFGQCCYGL